MRRIVSSVLVVTGLGLASAEAQSIRQQQYLNLAKATLSRPVTAQEMQAAFLAPQGVEAIADLFERSLAESLVVEGKLVTPELGGEATLDEGRLVLVSYPDPFHPLLREMVELQSEPQELLAFLESSADGKEVLKETGGLHALLFAMSRDTPTPQQRELLRSVVGSAIATRFKTWSVDPETQARMIETTDWRGRYLGFWHIHPIRIADGSLSEGIEPSVADMTNASQLGQFLTIVFQPEGFDAYDLSLLAGSRSPDLSRARIIRYRAPEWKSRFERAALARTKN